MPSLLGAIALCIYLLLGAQLCLSRIRLRQPPSPKLELFLAGLGLALQGAGLIWPQIGPTGLHFGASEALSLTGWCALFIFLLSRYRWPLDTLAPTLISIVSLFLLISLLLPQGHALNHAFAPLRQVHLTLGMLAHGLLTNAAALAIFLLIVERAVRHPSHRGPMERRFPPLLTLENLLFVCLISGFTLLTLTLISGSIFAQELWGEPMHFSFKIIMACLAWCTFATLLFGHYLYGWRGRLAAWWTLTGFVVLLQSYIGSRFILQVLQHTL